MKSYNVKVSPSAEKDLRDRIEYLVKDKKSKQAAANVMNDYIETRNTLSQMAGSIKNPENDKLRARRLKRINFKRHNYFLLFRIDENVVTITNVFHGLEDYENKLR